MEKRPHSIPERSVKGIMERSLVDLNQLPLDVSKEPKNDVPPPLHLTIDLAFPNEDMEVLKQKYKVLTSSSSSSASSSSSSSSSSFVNSDYFKNLGFEDGCPTMMHIRNKKIKMPRNSKHALARSLFKELTKKNEGEDLMVSLCEPIERNNDRSRNKGKKKVRFNCGPLDGIWKKKLLPKKRSGIVIFDNEYDA